MFWFIVKRSPLFEQLTAYKKLSLRIGNKTIVFCYFLLAAANESQILLYTNAKIGEVKGISLAESLEIVNGSSGVKSEVMKPITGIDRPVAIDFHAATEYVYYSDALRHVINRRKINGNQVEEVISSGQFLFFYCSITIRHDVFSMCI